jgi:hypothetical protein
LNQDKRAGGTGCLGAVKRSPEAALIAHDVLGRQDFCTGAHREEWMESEPL